MAVSMLEIAAQKGASPAYFQLGLMYLEGAFVKYDPEKALENYIKGAARNNAFCFFELSRLYAEGEVVEKDPVL